MSSMFKAKFTSVPERRARIPVCVEGSITRSGSLIDLKTPTSVTEPYITIAGQTAPGFGICIMRSEFVIRTRMFTSSAKDIEKLFTLVSRPFDAPTVRTSSAEEAYRAVLDYVGATVPERDSVDARLIEQVRTRTGRIIDSQNEVGGWPVYPNATASKDSDGDGIPDDWEIANHLNPHDPHDAAIIGADGYS